MTRQSKNKSMAKYNHKAIEAKWQRIWHEQKIYQPDMHNAKKPFYNLMMFPYPSAEGLHVGSVFTFSGIDIYGRFKRMQGYDVFQPIGLDAFGIHSENYALKTNTHPKDLSERTEANFYRQLHAFGNSFDWSHTIETNKPDYYKWTQWLFLQFYKAGLAERKKASVKWCPSCLTVLSDEQVISGRCERCNSGVTIKELEQWFFKITEYAEPLLQNLDWIDWDQSVKTMQRNWIGKKIGAEITFDVKDSKETLTVFTTRPDTLFGVAAIIVAPEHPLASQLATPECIDQVAQYIMKAGVKSETDRLSQSKVKTGVKTGSAAINPINNEEIPIYVSDYIIGSYGTGAIMLVPGHDQRDYEFAKVFNLPIKFVVKANIDISTTLARRHETKKTENASQPFTDYGRVINSDGYSELSSETASERIVATLEKLGKGRQKVSYHLRDWLISRQRYWGPPIPIVYCQQCGSVPVPEEQLPVELPYIEDFRPTGTGLSPLANHPEFYNVPCPNCGKQAHRETDVSDTFLDSSWYFLRYPSVGNEHVAFDANLTQKWLPVHSYIGGKEHTVLHLLYSRFVTMVLKDQNVINFDEPFVKFRVNGLIIKDGMKMSKSKGNVINPDDYIEKYGSDTLRCYLAFLGPFGEGGDFRDNGIAGMNRFINRVWNLSTRLVSDRPLTKAERYIRAKTIQKVASGIEELSYNTAIAAIMEYVNSLYKQMSVTNEQIKILLQILAPFAPHITDELYNAMNNNKSIHTTSWPNFQADDVTQETATIAVQFAGKTRGTVEVSKGMTKDEVVQAVKNESRFTKYITGEFSIIVYIADRIINFVS